MNRTKIEWTEYSWNPVTGCLHGCWYCYARKMAVRFPKHWPNGFMPEFHPERLNEPSKLRKPSRVFVCSVADLFAPWTPMEWRDQVLKAVFECPVKHTFQLLTKNPERIPVLNYPGNVWLGATVTGEENSAEEMNIRAFANVPDIGDALKFLSFEPLLGPIRIDLTKFQWIIIGHLTGARKAPFDIDWVREIVDDADEADVPVFMKNNLKPYLNGDELRQKYPTEVTEK